ncbi:hypothetical protein SPRG_02686 [Saprolegnia parasitica CBS 223.65]|uniref:Uncharacterized protein n=1 Tax=Saprolegnia parasitica (strain CBS 223.65) TaxID=695850 RepID=A0A067CUP8_SAPPC|nr:hypothetical protein SPRG_02686 [Saprolegnia parasitica CBS 223.65]KDO32995.1 hypothetical protein SPRG_02686 [Saprolegnia parasitica CBS 223.65]|eukprot:XP_012196639.1 hypothetical protein SPRG_02686 [Saprolegnia parasitica CBS 223.65]
MARWQHPHGKSNHHHHHHHHRHHPSNASDAHGGWNHSQLAALTETFAANEAIPFLDHGLPKHHHRFAHHIEWSVCLLALVPLVSVVLLRVVRRSKRQHAYERIASPTHV